MSRKVLNLMYTPVGGPTFGKVADPLDFMNSEIFSHEHVEHVTKDFLMKGETGARVSGFALALTTGLSMSIASGEAISVAGLLYDTIPDGTATAITLATAHPSLDRIDLIYGRLETDAEAETAFRPYRQVRTQIELEAGAPAYVPQDFNNPTQLQNRVTVLVHAGTASGSPSAPAAGVNEVALFSVRVPAGATALISGNVTDLRSQIRPLAAAWAQIDALNALPIIVTTNETIQDVVAAFMVDSSYFTKVYDDAGNLLTFDADLSAFDARYVNQVGDTMTGKLGVHDGLTSGIVDASGVESLVSKAGEDVSAIVGIGKVTSESRLARGVYGRAQFGAGNLASAWGGHFEAFANDNGNTTGGQIIGVRGRASGINQTSGSAGFYAGLFGEAQANQYAYLWAGYFAGDVNITGTIHKGSGTFLIDHPLDPQNKDLVHGFVESNEHMVLYRIKKTLAGGDVTLNLDTELGFTAGTFAKLTQAAEVVSVWNQSQNTYIGAGSVVIGAPVGGISSATLQLTVPDGDTSTVIVVIMAARNDLFIRTTKYVHATTHRLVPEQNKPVPTSGDISLLDPVTAEAPAGSPLIGQTVAEVVPRLIGMQGHPRHPSLYGGSLPTREVTYESE